jgi:stalled ribosome rescue protein Dom34
MDNHHATIVGSNAEATGFAVLGHAENPAQRANSSEKTANNLERTLVHQFFKEIGCLLTNADEVHLTGTGTIQEQFMHFLNDTPEFKRAVVTESTSNRTSEEKLVEFVSGQFK